MSMPARSTFCWLSGRRGLHVGQQRVQLRHAGIDQHAPLGMVDDVHVDRHPLALDVKVGDEDRRDVDRGGGVHRVVTAAMVVDIVNLHITDPRREQPLAEEVERLAPAVVYEAVTRLAGHAVELERHVRLVAGTMLSQLHGDDGHVLVAIVRAAPGEDEPIERRDLSVGPDGRILRAVSRDHRVAVRTARADVEIDPFAGRRDTLGVEPVRRFIWIGPRLPHGLAWASNTRVMVNCFAWAVACSGHPWLLSSCVSCRAVALRGGRSARSTRDGFARSRAETSSSGSVRSAHRRHWASAVRSMRPARSSTLRCWSIAGRLIANGCSQLADRRLTVRQARDASRAASHRQGRGRRG